MGCIPVLQNVSEQLGQENRQLRHRQFTFPAGRHSARHRSTCTGHRMSEQGHAHSRGVDALIFCFQTFGPERSTSSEPGRKRAQCAKPNGKDVRADRYRLRGHGCPRPGAPADDLQCIPSRGERTDINALAGA